MSSDFTRPDVQLDGADFEVARSLAQKTFDRWKSAPGYYTNTFESHLNGKVGEVALLKWLGSQVVSIDAAFTDLKREREADVIVSGLRIDMKTWAEKWWPEMGRCIAVKQLPSLRKKADRIVWGWIRELTAEQAIVVLAGWSTIEDVELAPQRNTGPKGRRQVFNHQIDEVHLRTMSSLLLPSSSL